MRRFASEQGNRCNWPTARRRPWTFPLSVLCANPESIRPVQERVIDVAGQEDDLLLFDWLSELLYVFETEHLLLADFVVRLDESGLHAVCRGEPAERSRHDLDHEVKAITYHGLQVRAEPDGWMAEVIVDI